MHEKKQELKNKEVEAAKRLRIAMEGYIKNEKSAYPKDQLLRENA